MAGLTQDQERALLVKEQKGQLGAAAAAEIAKRREMGLFPPMLGSAPEQPAIDMESGAPARVRAMVGFASKPEDRLATLRAFYEDAQADPTDPDNFIFTNPATGKPTLYNPSGLDRGDVASVVREGVQAVGGTVGGAVGAVGGLPGAVAGAGAGAAVADEVTTRVMQLAGLVDSRNLGERAQDAAITGGMEMAGAALGPVVGQAAKKGVRALAGGSQKVISETVQAFQRFGADPTVAEATKAAGSRFAENTLRQFPGAIGKMQEQAQRTVDKVQTFVNARVDALASGRATDPETVGRVVRAGIADETQDSFVTRFKRTSGDLYAAVDRLIPADTQVGVGEFRSVLDNISAAIPGAKETSKLLSNSTVDGLKKALDADAAGGSLPYEALASIRTVVGQRLSSPSLVDDIPRGQLKRIYAAITEDLRNAALTQGDDALQAFDRAAKYYKRGIDKIDNFLDNIGTKADTDKVLKSLEAAGKDGGTKIRAVMSSLNESERDLVAAGVLTRLGRPTAGQASEETTFSVDRFLTNLNNLDDKAKKAFFGMTSYKSLPDDLKALESVASTIKESAAFLNNRSNNIGPRAVTAAVSSIATAATVGGMAEAAGATALVGVAALGARGAAQLMTSPKFVNWLARASEIKPNGFGAHLGRLGAIAATADPETRDAITEYLTIFQ